MSETAAFNKDFFQAGGAMKLYRKSYVERPADDEIFNLTLEGEFCYVLTPRQMGKSSLMVRTRQRLRDQGVHTAEVDLTQAGSKGTQEQWYLSILSQINRGLRVDFDLLNWWNDHASITYMQRFSDYMRDVAVAQLKGKIVIFIDEIDSTLSLDFRDDFFAGIRSLYNARAIEPELDRLTFVMLGVASPADLISDSSRTPFNIGQGIELNEFSYEDTFVLVDGLKALHPEHGASIFDRIYSWTNGHPYLTQKLCLAVAETSDGHWTTQRIDELVRRQFLTEEVSKESNLKFIQDRILKNPKHAELLRLYQKVLNGKKIKEDGQSVLQNELKLSGIVKADNGYLKVRNEIYRHVFDNAWVRRNTPTNWPYIVAGLSIFVALIAVAIVTYNLIVDYQFNQAHTNYQRGKNEERLVNLGKIFSLRPIFSAGYKTYGLNLFFEDKREDQLKLFEYVNQNNSDELVSVVQGVYTSLADLEQNGESNELLQAMADALGRIDEQAKPIPLDLLLSLEEGGYVVKNKSNILQSEILAWLEGRQFVTQQSYMQAERSFFVAISLNSNNQATMFERAWLRVRLGQYAEALNDLDNVMAIALRVPAQPTPTPTQTPPQIDRMVTPTGTTLTSLPDVTISAQPGIQTPMVTRTPAATSIELVATQTKTQDTSTSTPTATPTQPSLSFRATFQLYNHMEDAVLKLIEENPSLQAELLSAPANSYPNLMQAGLVRTPTATLTSTIGPSPTETPTQPSLACKDTPSGWLMREVLPGETLESIAGEYDISVEILRQANCLTLDTLLAGSLLSVPPPTQTPTPTTTSTLASITGPSASITPRPFTEGMQIDNHRLVNDVGIPYPFLESPSVSKSLFELKYIVFHYTSSVINAEATALIYNNPVNAISTHIIIDRDGSIIQLVPFDTAAFHTGVSEWQGLQGLNNYSIGISLVNAGALRQTDEGWKSMDTLISDDQVEIAQNPNMISETGWQLYTSQQLDAALELALLLAKHYPTIVDVLGHYEISPDIRLDPGPLFPIEDFREKIFGRREPLYELRLTPLPLFPTDSIEQ